MKKVFELDFYGRKIVVENGQLAKQADGAVERRLPEGWKICEWWGESFRPNKSNQRFCGYSCQRKAADKRHRENASERQKAYRERKKEGAVV